MGSLPFEEVNSTISMGLPAYRRIEADLRQQIRSGLWPLGSAIPSRRALAEQYGVQLPTLQRAIAALLSDGTLLARSRQGTVVGRVDGVEDRDYVLKYSAPPDPLSMGNQTVAIIALVSFGNEPRHSGRNFNEPLVDSIEAVLGSAHVSSAFFSREHCSDRDCIQAAQSQGVDGLVVVLTQDSAQTIEQCLHDVEHLSIPVVFVTADPISAPYSTVCYDQKSAGYRAAQHLVRANARKIVFLAPFKARWLDERIDGAIGAVKRAGLPQNAFSVFADNNNGDPWGMNHEQFATEAARICLESVDLRGCGVVAWNDIGAEALINGGLKRGLQPGIDYQIIGFDDSWRARNLGISSLRPPSAAMGEEAANLILRQLDGQASVLQVSLQSQIVLRSSSRPLKGAGRSEVRSSRSRSAKMNAYTATAYVQAR